MNRNLNLSKRGFIYCFFFLLSCANVVPPSGGPRDSTPPQVVRTVPSNGSVNFSGNSLYFQFDEYLVLSQPGNQVIISPLPKEPPDFRQQGKTLTMRFKEPLDSQTTYHILFNEAIKDLNEGNVLRDFEFTFSTGSVLDSLFLEGRVLSADFLEPQAKVGVHLYADYTDSSIVKHKPKYYSLTDGNGQFKFQYLKSETFKVLTLKDENQNYLWDTDNELVAFWPEKVSTTDSATNIELLLFKEKPARLNLVSSRLIKQGHILVVFNSPVAELEVSHPQFGEYFLVGNLTRDTFNLWFADTTLVTDTIFLIANSNQEFKAVPRSVVQVSSRKKSETPSPFFLESYPIGDTCFQIKKKLFSGDSLILKLREPGQKPSIPMRAMVLKLSDSTLSEVYPAFAKSNTRLFVPFPWVEKQNYLVLLSDSVFSAYDGSQNPCLQVLVEVSGTDELGMLTVELSGMDPAVPYIVELLDKKKEKSGSRKMSGKLEQTLVFERVRPDSYQLRVFRDDNDNGTWDTGCFWEKKLPEKVWMWPEKIEMKPGWDAEIQMKLN